MEENKEELATSVETVTTPTPTPKPKKREMFICKVCGKPTRVKSGICMNCQKLKKEEEKMKKEVKNENRKNFGPWLIIISALLVAIIVILLWWHPWNRCNDNNVINGDLKINGNLIVDDITADDITADEGNFDKINANEGNFDKINANEGNFDKINANEGNFDKINANKVTTKEIVTEKVTIVTSVPTVAPVPTKAPIPTTAPTASPTAAPTASPTAAPTPIPTSAPISQPEWVRFEGGNFTLPAGASANTGHVNSLFGTKYSNVTGQIIYIINNSGHSINIDTVGGFWIKIIDTNWLVTQERNSTDWSIKVLVVNTNDQVTISDYSK